MEQHFKTPKGTELPLMDLKGKKYLQVAYRLVWFREEKPDWSIVTEVNERYVKATIYGSPQDARLTQVVATAHKSITGKDHFALEKAETGAVGRALAMCGFGTQFCGDDLEEGEEIADAPLGPENTVSDEYSTNTVGYEKRLKEKLSQPATEKQLKELTRISDKLGMTKTDKMDFLQKEGVNPLAINKGQASLCIQKLREMEELGTGFSKEETVDFDRFMARETEKEAHDRR